MSRISNNSPLPDAFVDACLALLGDRGVLLGDDDLERFEIDFWRQYRGNAALVLQPKSTEQVSALVTLARQHKVALVPQSGNTGLVRGGMPDESGLEAVLSLEAMNQIREIDPAGDYLICDAGCVLEDIQNAANEAGRMFALSLGSQGSCRIGGNISTNAGGVNVLRYGMTRDLVLGLEVVLADGQIWHGLSGLKKDNTGYDLKQLFIGAEGTLGIITGASLKLVAKPVETVTLWLAIPSPAIAIELYRLFRNRLGELISSFEMLTGFGLRAATEHLPGVRRPVEAETDWHLLIELAWSFDEGLMDQAEAVLGEAFDHGWIEDGAIAQSGDQVANMWRIREGQSEATRHIGSILRTDVSVKTNDIPDLIADVAKAKQKTAPDVTLLPFGHVGDGNLHFNFLIPSDQDSPSLREQLLTLLYDRIDARHGSISAEHGIGRLKQSAMLERKSPLDIDLMQRLKTALDPENILNPGVILPSVHHEP